jgi:tetratricopeptide (TPR) repeat protein
LVQASALFLETAKTLSDATLAERASLPRFFPAWPRAWVALVFAHLGRFVEAIANAEDAMRIAESAGHPHTVIEARGALASVRLEQGDLPGALRVFEEAMDLLRRRNVGDPNILSGLGYVYALSGRVADGLSLLEVSIGGEASISAMGLGLAVRLSRLAEAYQMAGRIQEATERGRSAVDLARKHRERANEALALRALAAIMARSDRCDAEAARQHYEASLALARQVGMRPLIAHCHSGLGSLFSRTGNGEQAAQQVAIAATMYRELGMIGWLDMTGQK